jgi:cytoskeletal protein CcmA (bactofilin family)
LGGKLQGNVNSDQITIKKTADINGELNQKTLSIHEGARLKIKTETYK